MLFSLQVLYYYVQLLIGKDKLLSDPENRFAKLLNLYYEAMNHAELNQCLVYPDFPCSHELAADQGAQVSGGLREEEKEVVVVVKNLIFERRSISFFLFFWSS